MQFIELFNLLKQAQKHGHKSHALLPMFNKVNAGQ